MKILFVAIVLALASCSSSGPSLDPATIGDLAYGSPSGWASRDLSTRQRTMIEWTPQDENNAKESLTIVRTERAALAKTGTARIEHLLDQALRGLPKARFSTPTRFVTKHGFSGVRVDGEFVPPGTPQPYRRLHAVLIDGTHVVHVMATAVVADREEFDAVLDSFTRKGA